MALELGAGADAATTIADLGSGAGIPGLPARGRPSERGTVVSLESSQTLANPWFIERANDAHGPRQNVHVVNARAEAWPDGRGRMQLVTARALAPLDVVAEYAAPLLTIGGALVAWRGKREAQVEAEGAAAAKMLGLSGDEPARVHPYDGAEHRYLHVMSKVMETPATVPPRRTGMARKRPLRRPRAPSDRGRR